MRNTLLTIASGLFAVALMFGYQQATATAPSDTPEGPAIEAGTYKLDPVHSSIGFEVAHMGISTVEGKFKKVSATIQLPEGNLSSLKAETSIKTKSVNTGDTDRDDHLRSKDFFAAKKHPEITFTSTGVNVTGDNEFVLKGDLTIRGVTKPVALEAEYLGSAVDPWGNHKIGLKAEGQINRKDFGLTWNKTLEAGGLLVGDEVTLVLDVQAVLQK